MLELGAAVACLGLDQNVLELRDAVLKHLGRGRCRYWGGIGTLPRQVQFGWLHRLDDQFADYQVGQNLGVEHSAFGHQLDFPRGWVLLLEVACAGDAQHPGSVCCDGHVDVELALLAQPLETLSDQLPVILGQRLGEGPVAVQTAA